jgi:hypothetical protein
MTVSSSNIRRNLLYTSTAALMVLAAVACAPSRQSRGPVAESGFLRNYSQLKPGKEGQMQLVYINHSVDWNHYTAAQFESVTLWPGKNGKLASLSPQDQQMLADRLYKAVYDAVSKEIKMVKGPGPGVARLRVALTEAEPTNVPLNAIATVVPQLRLLSTIVGLSADTALTVGSATIEGDVTDSMTGERLAAFVDERVGQRSVQAFGTWSQVQAAFDHWGQQMAQRLVQLRSTGTTTEEAQ